MYRPNYDMHGASSCLGAWQQHYIRFGLGSVHHFQKGKPRLQSEAQLKEIR